MSMCDFTDFRRIAVQFASVELFCD